jgi:hypothetical protein
MVVERGRAAQDSDELLPLWRRVHPVGQYLARHVDLVPAHREVVHLRLLFRPQAWRE